MPSVDVLGGIDNSCPMIEEQISLTDNFNEFVGYIVNSDLDYHIGVVSIDWKDRRGTLQVSNEVKWIDATVANSTEVFKEMAVLGTDDSANKKVLVQRFC